MIGVRRLFMGPLLPHLVEQNPGSCFSLLHSYRKRHQVSARPASGPELLKSSSRISNAVEANIDHIVRTTDKLGIGEKAVRAVLSANPDLARVSPLVWSRSLEDLVHNGVDPNQALNLVASCPKLLSISSEQMMTSWTCWKKALKQKKDVMYLINKHPHFLFCDAKNILLKCGFLARYFPGKVGKVLGNCPNIMEKRMTDVANLLRYVTVTMQITKESEIVASSVFNHSNLEVMTRLTFLERCGKFTPPNPKHAEDVVTGNPPLSKIFDTSPKYFATKVAKLTLEEFVVFQELFEMECKDVSDDESDFSDDE